ncbi:hypothetical protein QAD02_010865 [Eretmocerus hayati]|uniref:Uncharacterized protein n=1 Tax=Eretmocerus hayati TaxID=131215 RepID=A0ACC2NXQ8_9HYME|nr:hypothetical protein QAD02_010865 [Eretmocerus hayati]
MVIGSDGYEPIQTALVMTTTTVLELSADLLEDSQGFEFFWGSRIMNDVESIFSSVREKHPLPASVQLKNDLELITVSQYTVQMPNSNYDYDQCKELDGYIRHSVKKSVARKAELPTPSNDPVSQELVISRSEMDVLYDLAGYIMNSIDKH